MADQKKSTTKKKQSTTSSARTDLQNRESGFRGSQKLHDSLQRVLVDIVDLGIQGKQAHWSVVGPNFRDLHLQLDEIVEAAREFGDIVAERMRSMHLLVDARAETVASDSSLPKLPAGELLTTDVVDAMTERLDGIAATARAVHDDVDEEDPTSADILHDVLDRLEQLSWMVSAENRRPQS